MNYWLLGVASALRVHMGYIAGLVPGTKAASTCQVDTQGTRPPHPRCGSGPIISITSEEDRRLSLGLQRKECSEPRVNFTLPPRESITPSTFPHLKRKLFFSLVIFSLDSRNE